MFLHYVGEIIFSLGLFIGAFQDLRSKTVNLVPIILWIIGSLVYICFAGCKYGVIPIIIYLAAMSSYIHLADALALFCCSVFFEIEQVLLFSIITGVGCLMLYYFSRKKEIPMIPAIALGWFVVYFWSSATNCFVFLWVSAADQLNLLSIAMRELLR